MRLTLVGATKSSSWDLSPPSSSSSNAWRAHWILCVLATSWHSTAAASLAPVISKVFLVVPLPEHNHVIRTKGSNLLCGETLASRRLPVRSTSLGREVLLCASEVDCIQCRPSELWHCGKEILGDNGLPGLSSLHNLYFFVHIQQKILLNWSNEPRRDCKRDRVMFGLRMIDEPWIGLFVLRMGPRQVQNTGSGQWHRGKAKLQITVSKWNCR